MFLGLEFNDAEDIAAREWAKGWVAWKMHEKRAQDERRAQEWYILNERKEHDMGKIGAGSLKARIEKIEEVIGVKPESQPVGVLVKENQTEESAIAEARARWDSTVSTEKPQGLPPGRDALLFRWRTEEEQEAAAKGEAM